MSDTVRPHARLEKYSPSGDGGDMIDKIQYYCPICNYEKINEGQVACKVCRTFFDWSKRAYIRTIATVEWE